MLKPRGSVVLGDLFALADPTEAGVATLKTFGLHLLTADQWIAALVRAGIQVSESISIGHHVGVQSLVVCTDICRTAATEAEPGSLQRMILERTLEATALMAEGFRRQDVSWGIWTGRRSETGFTRTTPAASS